MLKTMLLMYMLMANFHMDYLEIPFVIKENVLMIELEINGKPANFIIDTGASVSVIDMNQAASYEVLCHHDLGAGKINGITGRTDLILTSKIQIQSKGLKVKRLKFYACSLESLCNYFKKHNMQIFGIIGSDYLIRNGAIIDYENQKLLINL